ncbi:MAG TPA: MaoC/PaaZ C-terminal domain-containing protein [Steroidobacteraceae bacterium]|nr:MaoC/PaaZ C-terminal domain-containing protein [Steroidobacteraceae bacterium]
MTIQYPAVLNYKSPAQDWSFTERDAMLYALCLGFGGDPLNERTLPFVYEKQLKVVPTLPTVMAWVVEPTFAALGADPKSALHGEQKIELHRAITMPLKVSVQGSVLEVYDKGADRGAILMTRHVITDAADGGKVATLTTSCFARAEGGCGGSAEAPPRPHAVPGRPPDQSLDIATRADLALQYRLTGDRNPIHAEPDAARDAGFARPLLHGLCSFGISCRAVLEAYADFDPRRIASHQARFASPVYPGEILTVDLWRDDEVVSFEARIKARGVTVMKNGKSMLR